MAPGAIDGAVEDALAAALGLQLVHDLAHALRCAAARDEEGIRRLDDDRVLEPDADNQSMLRVEIGSGDIMQANVTPYSIAFLVMIRPFI